MGMKLRCDSFSDGDTIPRRFTEDGEDLSPPLEWGEVPAEAKELVLIVDDPDAPRKEPWIHWVLAKIPPELQRLEEGVARTPHLKELNGAVQAMNSWDSPGYRGPAPPPGHGIHHYRFQLYALDTALPIEVASDKDSLMEAIQGHVVAEAQLVGTYAR